ncbi:MAG: hypothetical protein F4090_04260 [Nitrospira sp. SB0672_bin_25]|nr:hypothetical protein [Nitrospira sp. SB0672_bin_25]
MNEQRLIAGHATLEPLLVSGRDIFRGPNGLTGAGFPDLPALLVMACGFGGIEQPRIPFLQFNPIMIAFQ